MGKISLMELAAVLSKKYGLNKKEATEFVSKMFDIIQQSLEQEKTVKVKGLGTFKIIDVDARESVNVNTGERVLIEGHNKITFVPDTLMKDLVNKPFSQFETVVLNDGVDFEDAAANESLVSESEEGPILEPSAMPLVDFVDRETEEDTPEWVIEPVTLGSKAGPELEPKPEQKSTSNPEKEETFVELSEGEEVEQEAEAEEAETDLEWSEEEPSNGNKWLLPLVALLIGLAAGYLLGNFFPFQTQPAQQEVVKSEEPKTPPVKKPVVTEPIDSIVAEEPKVEEVEKEVPKVEEVKQEAPHAKEVKQESPKAESPKSAKPAEKTDGLDKYQKKDSRVRLGAWRIVGTAQVVKAKQGETIARISRHYLGPDMECYVEVYNDLTASTPLKAGQEIKIPKLEHKKLRK